MELMYRIAVIAGDGVGKEVVPEGIKVIEAVVPEIGFEPFDWGADYYERHGSMMPADALETLQRYDAIYLGACGWPTVPDHISLWGLLLPIRKAFELYVNLRPIRCLRGISGPLVGHGAGDVDMLFIRENTEGEYSGTGGRVHVGHKTEVAVEVPVFSRHAIERCARYAFARARERSGTLVSVTKSNASRYAYVLWDEVVAGLREAEFPDVTVDRVHVDAMAARMVTRPQSIDVVVASNLFADILTDLGAAIQGSLGLAASANLNPEREHPSLFEPVHGSAPDIAGQAKANPIGAIWSGALMLRHLGELKAAATIEAAIESVTAKGEFLTADLGGKASTQEVGAAVAREARAVRATASD
jgi:tartrate dehydrogenase/decarboxylase / D-malate dehydrogenase